MAHLKRMVSISDPLGAHWVGDGFPVKNIFSYHGLGQVLSPFLMMDYAAPTEFPPSEKPKGVGEHPHRGFETVTIVYQGEIEHRDSAGNSGKISSGDVQWMTAASGVVHEELHSKEFSKTGGMMEMIQLWVNLPSKDKMGPPRYQGVLSKDIPVVKLTEKGSSMRIIAGSYQETFGPAKTHTPIHLWDLSLKANDKIHFSLPDGSTTALFIRKGEIMVDQKTAVYNQMIVFENAGTDIEFEASADSSVLLMNGEPLNEKIIAYGPFVMNTEGEIRQAMLDYQNGKMGHLR